MNTNVQAAESPRPAVRRGRPRDPNIEVRVYDAALTLYGDQGWPGFNFDAISKLACVGKDALYRRWESREALLGEALRQRWAWLEAIDEGSVRGDLIALGRMTLDVFAGTYGDVALQLRADSHRFPEVLALAEPYRESTTRLGRYILRRAIDRGDLPPYANPGLILDLLIGGVINHVISTPGRLKSQMMERADLFVRHSVDIILTGLQNLGPDDSKTR